MLWQSGSMDEQNATTQSTLPGQMVIPGFESVLGVETIVLKVQQERFCQLLVLQGGLNQKKAYMRAYPEATEKAAEANASRLLRNDKVRGRIVQIQAEMRRRVAAAVVNYHLDVMEINRRDAFLDEYGKCKALDQIDERATAILEFEQVSAKDGVRTLLKVPSRHQSAVELAKIAGMHKDKVELTGKDGGPVEHSIPALMREIMGTTRDLVQEKADG